MFNHYKRSIDFIRELLKSYKIWIIVVIVETFFSSIFSLILPYLAKIETDQLVQKNTNLYFLTDTPLVIFIYIIGVIIIIEIIDKAFTTALSWLKEKYTEEFADALFIKMYKRLQYVEIGIYANKRNQDLFDRILGQKYFVWSLLQTIMTYLNMVIFIIWSIGILSQVDKKIGIALFLWWVTYYIFYYFEKKIDVYRRFQTWQLERSMREIEWITRSEFHRLAYAWWTQLIEDTMKDYNTTRREIVHANNKKKEIIDILKNIITKLIENGIKIIIWLSIFSWTASLWSLVLTIALLQKLSWFISSIINSKKQIEDATESFDILNLYLDATSQKDGILIDYEEIIYDSICIKNLKFAYPSYTTYELQYFDIMLKRLNMDKDTLSDYHMNKIHVLQEAKENATLPSPIILDDVSLQLKKWNIYGIVGKNWAGKTTLMHLLMNYFHLENNSIMRWSVPSNKLPFQFFEENIAVVEQQPFILWGFTLKQNILLWVKQKYDDEELYVLLKMFDLDEKIRKFRKWLDTVYSYDCDLSWWQLQIIALLRVYLQNKPVMILDEGTNQLDATNELKIMNLLLDNKKDKIIVMISHRMTSLQKADMLFCLENGRIKDFWSPNELKKRKSLFQKFWNEQVEYMI